MIEDKENPGHQVPKDSDINKPGSWIIYRNGKEIGRMPSNKPPTGDEVREYLKAQSEPKKEKRNPEPVGLTEKL